MITMMGVHRRGAQLTPCRFCGEKECDYSCDEAAVAQTIDWKKYFENGECPDCGEQIVATPGRNCVNCGHVFWTGDPIIDSVF